MKSSSYKKLQGHRVAVIHNVDYLTLPTTDDAIAPPSREAEEEVARTALAIGTVLAEGGMEPYILNVADSLDEIRRQLIDLKVKLVFNLVESLGNDPAREPEFAMLLEQLRIPYTGNGPATLRLAHRKERTRRLLAAHHLPVAAGFAVNSVEELTDELMARTKFPVFVKPAHTDASIGIDQNSVVRTPAALRKRVTWLRKHIRGPVLVEAYLPGREINVAIFPNPITGQAVPTEIDFSPFPPGLEKIVTYNCKWQPNSPEYAAVSRPAIDRIPPELYNEVRCLAFAAFLTIGGVSYGRVDMRLNEAGRPHIIDVNPNPDIDCEAGLAIAARSVGVEYPDLIAAIAEDASLKE